MAVCKPAFTQNDHGFRFLTKEKADAIYEKALYVLETIGIDLQHEGAVSDLVNLGATVEDGRVLIPADLVKKALKTAPSGIKMYSRNGEQYLNIEGRNAYFGGGANHIYTLDRKTQKRRHVEIEDVVMVAKIFDYMPNLDFAGSLGRINGVTDYVQDVLQFHTMITNTATCPIDLSIYNMESLKVIIEMAIAVRGSKEALKEKPFMFFMTPSNSPLMLNSVSVERMYLLGSLGIPCVGNAGILSGGTGPATMAGAVVQAVAESLTGLVVHQMKNPGAPYIFCGILANLDFKTGGLVQGCPEQAIMTGAAAEMAHYFDLPFFGSGGFTDAKLCDSQAAIEGMLTIMGQALVGGGLVHGLGYMESALLSSPELLVMSDEIIGMLKKTFSNLEVNEDEFAIDVIRDVCLNGSQYIYHDHSVKHCRDRYNAQLLSKDVYQLWESNGSKTMRERINEKIDYILDNHVPEPLPKEIQSTVDRLLEEVIKKDKQ